MEAAAKNINRLFYLVSIYVILTFLSRFLVPAYEESDTDALIYLKILLELAQVASLIILFSYLRPHYGGDSTAMLTTVFLIALVASIGILVMRFSTTHGWYTGHRVYYPGGYRS
jgi:heme/copper-type cytochrome/quinol oxidase subunit 4